MLHILFALNGSANIIIRLVVNEHLQPEPLREAFDRTFPVLIRAPRQIACDADIKRAVAPVAHDVDPATHALPPSWPSPDLIRGLSRPPTSSCFLPTDVDARDKP